MKYTIRAFSLTKLLGFRASGLLLVKRSLNNENHLYLFQISMSVPLLVFVVMVRVQMFLAVIHALVLLVLNVVVLRQAVKVNNGILRI